ncbi:MAG: anthranilate synthase component II [Chitinophagales bacterium]
MILLLDNYDSFTWNLYDYLAQSGRQIEVVRNDSITVADIQRKQPEALVISPGPKTPPEAGITMQVIDQLHSSIPMLGICLGYQALGMYFGARLVRSTEPVHGKTSLIEIQPDPIFNGMDSPLQAMRYHSLNITEIPAHTLEIIAFTAAREPMAIKHRHLPLYGFLFHPESILTLHGKQLILNWVQQLPTGGSGQGRN